MDSAQQIFALTTRGLEAVSAKEIGALPGVTVDLDRGVGYRRVVARCVAPLASLLDLRTVDDVFLDVATWSGIGRPRSTLATLGDLSAQLDLYPAATACSQVRPVGRPPLFSVTVSFVGKRNYSTPEIKEVCAEGIVKGHGWTYTEDDAAADLNVRLFIEHEIAYVGVRLGERSLHRRTYKAVHRPGSLKPPVAAALLFLAGVRPGLQVLDPCCGGGTILIEAAASGAEVCGGDLEPAAVSAARTNAQAAGVAAGVNLWDAQALPLADGAVDRIVSNLPWGRQAEVESTLRVFYRHACAEMRRVVAAGGKIALLTNAPELVELYGLEPEARIEISLYGQTPTIMVFRA